MNPINIIKILILIAEIIAILSEKDNTIDAKRLVRQYADQYGINFSDLWKHIPDNLK